VSRGNRISLMPRRLSQKPDTTAGLTDSFTTVARVPPPLLLARDRSAGVIGQAPSSR